MGRPRKPHTENARYRVTKKPKDNFWEVTDTWYDRGICITLVGDDAELIAIAMEAKLGVDRK